MRIWNKRKIQDGAKLRKRMKKSVPFETRGKGNKRVETEKIKTNSDENCARQSPSGSAAMPRFRRSFDFPFFRLIVLKRALGFGARARSARVTVRRQPHRQRSRRLVSRQAHVLLPLNKILTSGIIQNNGFFPLADAIKNRTLVRRLVGNVKRD